MTRSRKTLLAPLIAGSLLGNAHTKDLSRIYGLILGNLLVILSVEFIITLVLFPAQIEGSNQQTLFFCLTFLMVPMLAGIVLVWIFLRRNIIPFFWVGANQMYQAMHGPACVWPPSPPVPYQPWAMARYPHRPQPYAPRGPPPGYRQPRQVGGPPPRPPPPPPPGYPADVGRGPPGPAAPAGSSEAPPPEAPPQGPPPGQGRPPEPRDPSAYARGVHYAPQYQGPRYYQSPHQTQPANLRPSYYRAGYYPPSPGHPTAHGRPPAEAAAGRQKPEIVPYRRGPLMGFEIREALHLPAFRYLFGLFIGSLIVGYLLLTAGWPWLLSFPVTFLIAFTFPSLMWISYIYHRTQRRPEPQRLVFIALTWGMFSTIPALIFNTLGMLALDADFQALLEGQQVGGAEWAAVAVVAPLVEEFFKPLGLLLIFRRLDSSYNGVLYGVTTGMGFALVENMSYELSVLLGAEVETVWTATTFVRGVGSTLLHAVGPALVGYFLACARYKGCGYIWVLGAYLMAVAIHASWNTAATISQLFPQLELINLVEIGALLALFLACVLIIRSLVQISMAQQLKMPAIDGRATPTPGPPVGPRPTGPGQRQQAVRTPPVGPPPPPSSPEQTRQQAAPAGEDKTPARAPAQPPRPPPPQLPPPAPAETEAETETPRPRPPRPPAKDLMEFEDEN